LPVTSTDEQGEKMIKKEWLLLIILASLTLIMSVGAATSPWWRISTTKRYQILNGTTMVVDYYLSGEVRAAKICNETQIVYLNIKGPWNLTLLREYLGKKQPVMNISIPTTKILEPSLSTEISFGAHTATFEGIANITMSEKIENRVFLSGNFTIEDQSIPFNHTYEILIAGFPTEHLGTLLIAIGETTVTVEPITTTITNLSSDKGSSLNSFFNIIFSLTIVGSSLNTIVFLFIMLQAIPIIARKPPYKYARYITAIAALLFLASFIYFAVEAPGLISKLSDVTPPEVYKLQGINIKSLFGALGEIVYGPAVGFFLALTTSLVNITLYFLVRKVEKYA